MRFALPTAAALCSIKQFANAAAAKNPRNKPDRLRRTQSGKCAIRVVKLEKGEAFECEMDPLDVNGESGVTRAIKASPEQVAALKAMLDSGDLVPGEAVLNHGPGTPFDEESIFLGPDLSIMAEVRNRNLQTDPPEEAGKGKGGGGKGKGKGRTRYIVTFADKKKGGEVPSCKALAQAHGGTVGHVYDEVLSGCSLSMPDAAVSALESDPSIAMIEKDVIVTTSDAPSWGLDRIDQLNLPLDDEITRMDATGVKVYIVDTGIRARHNDFIGRIDRSSRCHSDQTDERDALEDANGHGTHVASTACGVTYGVAKNCELCAVKVLYSDGTGYMSDVIAGYNFVARNCNGGRCVMNASLGGSYSDAGNEAVKNAVRAGVVVVVAAGNLNRRACNYSPASEPTAITVGSTTSSDDVSSFSNYGSCVDVYAPGSFIKAAWNGGNRDTKTISGTSMASPHVAGIAAGHLAAGIAASQVANEIFSAATVPGIDSRTPDAGLATIFSSSTPPAPCTGLDVEVKLKTDNYPRETAWTFTNQCGTGKIYESPEYSGRATLISTELCLPNDEYEFVITDSWGDGICCGYGRGYYEVHVDGAKVHEGGNFGSSESKRIGSCQAGPGPTPSTPNPTNQPTSNPTDQPTSNPTDQPTSNPTNQPTSNPTSQPTSNPTSQPTLADQSTPNPTDQPTPNPTDQPTANPTANPTGQPTPNPTDQPTPNPTDQPSNAPTNHPTDYPTTQPTNHPTSSTNCNNDPDWTFISRNGSTRRCDWVAGRPNRRCKKVGEDNREARDACPAACDEC